MTNPGILPDVDEPLAAPFWAAAREGRLVAQRCASCGTFRWTPSEICPECLSPDADWTSLRGTAAVWSYAVYRRAMHPAFADSVPYTVAMLELPEGIRMLGKVDTSTGDAERDGELSIGDTVRAAFDRVSETVTLVRWTASNQQAEAEEPDV